MSRLIILLDIMEDKKTLSQLTINRKGGVKASRNNPKYYSKQNQKEPQSDKKTSFSRKHLSLESAHNSLGISQNLINLLKIGTSGDITSSRRIKLLLGQTDSEEHVNYSWRRFAGICLCPQVT